MPGPRASGTPGGSLSPTQVPGRCRCPHTLRASSNTGPATTASPSADAGPGTSCWPVGTASLPAVTASVLVSSCRGGTAAPKGAAADPAAWVLAPAPPHPTAGWEPQTEIPPVAAGPAPVTPGTRRSGYTSCTHRQTRHSSAGTGAPAPTTAPGMGTTVPRHRRHQRYRSPAAPWVPAHWILEGAGQSGSAPRTAGQSRSTLGTPTRTLAPPGPARPPPRDTGPAQRTAGPAALPAAGWGVTVPECPIPVPRQLLGSGGIVPRQPLAAVPGCF